MKKTPLAQIITDISIITSKFKPVILTTAPPLTKDNSILL